MLETMEAYGADSFAGRLVSVVHGSTETTFYVLAVYFGAIGVHDSDTYVTGFKNGVTTLPAIPPLVDDSLAGGGIDQDTGRIHAVRCEAGSPAVPLFIGAAPWAQLYP